MVVWLLHAVRLVKEEDLDTNLFLSDDEEGMSSSKVVSDLCSEILQSLFELRLSEYLSIVECDNSYKFRSVED